MARNQKNSKNPFNLGSGLLFLVWNHHVTFEQGQLLKCIKKANITPITETVPTKTVQGFILLPPRCEIKMNSIRKANTNQVIFRLRTG
jgi:hypothetical protein